MLLIKTGSLALMCLRWMQHHTDFRGVGVQLTIFHQSFHEEGAGPWPLLSPSLLLLLQPAFPAELLAASRHWGRNSSGADKWQMTLASSYIKGPEQSRMACLSLSVFLALCLTTMPGCSRHGTHGRSMVGMCLLWLPYIHLSLSSNILLPF